MGKRLADRCDSQSKGGREKIWGREAATLRGGTKTAPLKRKERKITYSVAERGGAARTRVGKEKGKSWPWMFAFEKPGGENFPLKKISSRRFLERRGKRRRHPKPKEGKRLGLSEKGRGKQFASPSGKEIEKKKRGNITQQEKKEGICLLRAG